MLPRAWPLHDIACTESFCAALATKVRRELTHDQRERLLADLISATWELSLVYQPTVGKVRFTTFATHHHKRITIPGWLRKEFGRTKWTFRDRVYERQLPVFVEHDDSLETPTVDSPERGDPDDERLVPGGDISPSAYLPPGDLLASRRTRRPPVGQASGDEVQAA